MSNLINSLIKYISVKNKQIKELTKKLSLCTPKTVEVIKEVEVIRETPCIKEHLITDDNELILNNIKFGHIDRTKEDTKEFKVFLKKGVKYVFHTKGMNDELDKRGNRQVLDTNIELQSTLGTRLAYNDDSDWILARFSFTPNYSGEFKVILGTFVDKNGVKASGHYGITFNLFRDYMNTQQKTFGFR